MKKSSTYISAISALLVVAAGLLSGATALAQNCGDHGKDETTAPVTNEASDQTKAAYPLTTCVVSGNKLGDMGPPVDYIYKEAGKPDRLVRFCCKNCIKDFKKDPAKYLKMIDDAAAGKTGAGKTGKTGTADAAATTSAHTGDAPLSHGHH